MSKNTDDWPTTVRKYDETFGAHKTHKRPNLKGKNFMTDDILGHVLTDAGEPVEISTGRFMEIRLIGVTFGNLGDGTPDPRNGCFDSVTEAYEHLFGGVS